MTLHNMIQPVSSYLRPGDSLEDAARIMLETRLDTVPVGDAEGKLIGVFSRSSLYRMVLAKLPFHTPIRSFIKTDAFTTRVDALTEATFEQMEQAIRDSKASSSVIVDHDRRIVGMLTPAKVVRALVEAKNDLREQMEAIMQAERSGLEERSEPVEKTGGKHSFQATHTWDHILTRDKTLKQVIAMAIKAARRDSPVLLLGESGTGKELFAHAIHNSSRRAGGPFLTINCSSIPEHLLEAEIFGYDTGAFTGADRGGRIGKVELANGGTLFLDEIGDMPLGLQAKLLRVVEGKDYFRVGGTKLLRPDVRIISATNAALGEMMAQKAFRQDLYYRLQVVTLSLPPLRARKNDILLLANAFVKQLNPQLDTTVSGIDENAQRVLYHYEWPGNVRQLRNVIERAMIMAETGKLTLADLPEEVVEQTVNFHGKGTVQEAERRELERALRETNGNKTKASRLLGISRSALYEKLKKYRI
ncbi:sigma 54-interacting transcriptional regulator [Brevibacillus sp. TJ4]|uniref:sigma 54-interacting transcriptional regulator n=1 Tax=Brevibacillus sp. TJ4 TaxID=3234853 RepID=UPI0037D3EF80